MKNPHLYIMVFADALLFAAALSAAYLLRFELHLEPHYTEQLKDVLILLVPLKILVYFLFGLYRGMWRYTSVRDFWRLLQASATATLLVMTFLVVAYRFEGYSRSIFLIDGGLTFLFTGGLRMAIRSLFTLQSRSEQRPSSPSVLAERRRVAIIGAGSAGEKILREILENNHLSCDVAGFIDDDPHKIGRAIHGVPILGSLPETQDIVKNRDIREILIAIPSATGEQMRRIIEICKDCRTPFKTLPWMGDLIDGRVSVKALRDVNYEEPARAGARSARQGGNLVLSEW